jgi:hypothetical protein
MPVGQNARIQYDKSTAEVVRIVNLNFDFCFRAQLGPRKTGIGSGILIEAMEIEPESFIAGSTQTWWRRSVTPHSRNSDSARSFIG